ncbi:MAG TPA: serine hydrolase [Pyrinomonadaceae bacterium]|nr:serine hydrolase [Pyrinomonadaceae bacterium]
MFAVPLSAQTAAVSPTSEMISARIDEYMNAAVRAEHFSGSILVAKDGRPIVSRGYGMANYELDVPNAPHTVFQIASLTKAFTAAAVMQLQEKGKLCVNDAICKYLENCPPTWRPITVKHLLTHTSGLANYTNLPGYEQTAGRYATEEEVVALFRDKPLEFVPGEKYQYSNSGYHLLGIIIEKVSGKSYADYLHENIFAPLGMKNSGRGVNKRIVKNRAAGYVLENDALVNARSYEMAFLHAEGGLYSTTEDMLAWDQALYTEKILSRKSLDEMFTPFKGIYGYGWNITSSFDRKEIRHAGLNFGFAAHIKRFPDDKVTVIVLSNNQTADAGRVAADLSAVVFGAPYRVPREAKVVAPQVLEKYAGRYEMSPAMIVTVTLENGRLYGQGTGQGKTQIFAASETEFFLKNADVKITFDKDGRGNVVGMTVLKDGRETKARKIRDE